MNTLVSSHKFRFFVVVLLSVLVALSVGFFWRQTETFKDELIADHIATLATIFNKIDQECTILGFEHQKNYIDFLTVQSFVGSEVGAMNLKYPQKWKGPYLDDNPTIQEQYYQIVRTKFGYFIVPGDGVALARGVVIGKDILFKDETDIQALITTGILAKDGKPLAAKITVSGK